MFPAFQSEIERNTEGLLKLHISQSLLLQYYVYYLRQSCGWYTLVPRGVMNLSCALLPFPFTVHQLKGRSQTSI